MKVHLSWKLTPQLWISVKQLSFASISTVPMRKTLRNPSQKFMPLLPGVFGSFFPTFSVFDVEVEEGSPLSLGGCECLQR